MSSRFLSRLLTGLLVLVMCPTGAFAQDGGSMSFGVDEVEQDDQNDQNDQNDPQESSGQDDGEMSFGTNEVEDDAQASTATTRSLAVVVIPSDALTRSERIELQENVAESVSLAPNYSAVDGAQVLSGLQDNGIGSCIAEPLCLADIGRDAGVDRILIGTVEDSSRGKNFKLDLFDVTDKLFVKYASARGLSGIKAVGESVDPTMKDLFDIRVARKGPDYGEEAASSTVQTALASTAAGLAAVSLGVGIYFGTQASSGEDDIVATQSEAGQFSITQARAQQMVRDAEDDALTANVLYGASAGLAVISGILFIVRSTSDEAPADTGQRATALETLDVAPTVGSQGVGVGASLRF